MSLSCQSELQFTHLNVNMGLKGVRDNYLNSLYGTFAFFLETSNEKIYSKSNMEKIISPVLKKGGDVLCFSEIYGKQGLDIAVNLLESNGYNTYFVDAFDMWSHDIQGEHLYNLVGINSKIDNKKGISINTQLKNKRKLEGIMISLKNLLSLNKGNNGSIVENTKILYNRLANGILDGAITTFELNDDFIFSHLHIHADNEQLHNYFIDHVFGEKGHIILGDFNIGNLDNFILNPPFSGIGYKIFLDKKEKTYSFAKGLSKLPLYKQPDNIIGNNKINNIYTGAFNSFSDHNGIISRIKPN